MTARWSGVASDEKAETPVPGTIWRSIAGGFFPRPLGQAVSKDVVTAGARDAKRRL